MNLGERIRDYGTALNSGGDQGATATLHLMADEADVLETERDAWKEAFAATRSYYRNNTGANAKRYREAVKRLKEKKLIK